MARLKTSEIILPAYWASALINGDFSGLSDSEAARCEKAMNDLAADGSDIVDCGEAWFTWSYRLYDFGADCLGGDVCSYTLLTRRKGRA